MQKLILISLMLIIATSFGGWEVVEDQTRLLSPDGTETLRMYRDIDNDNVYIDWTFGDLIMQGGNVTISGGAATSIGRVLVSGTLTVPDGLSGSEAGPTDEYPWFSSQFPSGIRIYQSDSIHPDGTGGPDEEWSLWWDGSTDWIISVESGVKGTDYWQLTSVSLIGSYTPVGGVTGTALVTDITALESTLTADEIIVTGLDPLTGVYTDTGRRLTSVAPSSGILGYWDRLGTTLTMSNQGDILDLEDSFVRNAGYVLFDLDFADGNEEGRLQWNTDDGTLELGMPGGNVNGQLLQELLARTTNGTASLIPNGMPVYITGGAGGASPIVYIAPADADFATGVGFRTIGFATEDIPASQKGYVTTYGFVRDIDTSAFASVGSPVYLASGGGLATAPPAAPDVTFLLGTIARVHATEGVIYATLTSIPNLSSLSDVTTTGLIDASVLQWNLASDVWEPLIVWDDLRFPVSTINLGLINAPTQTLYKGGITLAFADTGVANQEEDVYFSAQLPHGYKEGSDIDVHIHWTPEDDTAGNVYWTFSYSWSSIDGIFPAPTEVNAATTCDQVTDKHQLDDIAVLDGTGKTISSMLICRLTRHSSNALDTYDGKEPYLHEIDIHYQMDTVGSRNETSK